VSRRAACGGYICFEDEAGFTRKPPRGRTWGQRGVTPFVTVSGRRSGRLSVAGLIAMRPGSRTRLCHRLICHPSGKGKRRSMGERDFIALIDGAHQFVQAAAAQARLRQGPALGAYALLRWCKNALRHVHPPLAQLRPLDQLLATQALLRSPPH
jgi:hypothetical protein